MKCLHGQRQERSRYVSFFNQDGSIGFSVLRFRLFFRLIFGFCAKKNSSFSCSFRFADFTRFSIWFSVFVKNTKRVSGIFFDLSRSERQLSSSTDLEQPRNANVIERNAKQTKCHWNNFSLVKFRSAPWEVTGLSTSVDQFANYGVQRASRTGNRRGLRTLRSNCGLCRLFLNWLVKWYKPLAYLGPRWHYTTLLDTAVGFLDEKNKNKNKESPSGSCASLCHAAVYFGLWCKIYNCN